MFRAIAVLLLSSVVGACGPAAVEPVTHYLELDTFDSVELRADVDVEVLFGEVEHVSMTCEPSIIEELHFEVDQGALQVLRDHEGLRPADPCVVDLRMFSIHRLANYGPSVLMSPADLAGRIDEIEVVGTGTIEVATAGTDVLDVHVEGPGQVFVGEPFGGVRASERLSVRVADGGEATLADINLEVVEVDIIGDGAVFMGGEVDELHIDSKGPATVGAAGLTADRVWVQVTDGTAVVRANTSVHGRVSGRGTLVVYGDAELHVDVAPSARLVVR